MGRGSYSGGSTIIGPHSKGWFSKSNGPEEPLPQEVLDQIEAKRDKRKAEKKRKKIAAKKAGKLSARERAEEKAARDRAKAAASDVTVEVRRTRKVQQIKKV